MGLKYDAKYTLNKAGLCCGPFLPLRRPAASWMVDEPQTRSFRWVADVGGQGGVDWLYTTISVTFWTPPVSSGARRIGHALSVSLSTPLSFELATELAASLSLLKRTTGQYCTWLSRETVMADYVLLHSCDLRWKSREAHWASLLSELTVHLATTKQLYSPR